MSNTFVVSASPHIRSKDSVSRIMLDVIIALLPATLFGVYNFGPRAFIITLLCIGTCVGTEAFIQRIRKQVISINDYSAVVTGLLLALNLPHTVPFWIPIIGGVFAIFIVKQLFGGLGQNFMNPALGARAFLLISYAGIMTNWQLDGVTTATPLGIMKEGGGQLPTLMTTFIGTIGGCIGETSAFALIIGGVYLIARRIISPRIPVTFILTTAICVLLFGGKGFDLEFVAYHLFTGGLMIGAFFMATDYASSPSTKTGQIIMGVGCGLLTALIRIYGSYPEGVSFSIIFMNLLVPIIDKYTIPKAFGEVAK